MPRTDYDAIFNSSDYPENLEISDATSAENKLRAKWNQWLQKKYGDRYKDDLEDEYRFRFYMGYNTPKGKTVAINKCFVKEDDVSKWKHIGGCKDVAKYLGLVEGAAKKRPRSTTTKQPKEYARQDDEDDEDDDDDDDYIIEEVYDFQNNRLYIRNTATVVDTTFNKAAREAAVNMLVESRLVHSKGEAKRMVRLIKTACSAHIPPPP